MRYLQRGQGPLSVVLFCALLGAALTPIAASAEQYGDADALARSDVAAMHFQNGPCGLLSEHGKEGADLRGIWQCARRALLPNRFRDTDSDSSALRSRQGPVWRMRVRQDQVMLSIGVKW